ncbi:MAG: tetratricopeptide repeat protein [Polyangiaceae bacterium]
MRLGRSSILPVLLVALLLGCASPVPPLTPDERLAELDAACTRRHLASCLEAGRGYAARLEAAPDDARAARRLVLTLHLGCMMDHGAACDALASELAARPSLVRGRERALLDTARFACRDPRGNALARCAAGAYRARACDLGVATPGKAVATAVAEARYDGPLGDQDPRALHALACERGAKASCLHQAEQLLHSRHGHPRDPRAAAALFDRACRTGSGRACRRLAELHARGDGRPIDAASARRLFDRACELEDGSGCHGLARLLRLGLGGDAQPVLAMRWLREGCDRGDPTACEQLALALEHGDGLPEDKAAAFESFAKAATLHEAACDAEDMDACAELGRLLRQGRSGGPADEARGRALQRRACEAGSAAGCLGVMLRGRHLLTGDGPVLGGDALARRCASDDAEACHLLARLGKRAAPHIAAAGLQPQALLPRACDLGFGPACNAAGLEAFPPSASQRAALRRGCDLGHALSCHHLGLVFEVGEGQDLAQAAPLHRRACAWGLASACTRLGQLRAGGGLSEASPGAAETLFRRACDRGDAAGCEQLGRMLIDGTQIRRDSREGRMWLEHACREGAPSACHHLGQLLLSGRPFEVDTTRGLELLRQGCREGEVAACAAEAELWRRGEAVAKKDEARSEALLRQAAPLAVARCARGLDVCYDGRATAVATSWTTLAGTVERLLSGVPACDAPLERLCQQTTEITSALCEQAGEGCFEAVDLALRLRGVGLGPSRARVDALAERGEKAAKRACEAGKAAACEQLAAAHRSGRGVARDAARADRYQQKACRLDPARCPQR